MINNYELNIRRLKVVSGLLAGLEQDVVFVGGAVVALYVNKETATEVRPTEDIDVVVELISYGSYADLEARLRDLGFQNDVASGIICRFIVQGITVDVMPTESGALGFSNQWYPGGFKSAIDYPLDDESTIKLFSLPYFVASKWEACKSRGGNDLRFSSDFEDLVYVLDQAPNAEAELINSPAAIRIYLRQEFAELLKNPSVDEFIYGHLEPRYASRRTERILQMLEKLAH